MFVPARRSTTTTTTTTTSTILRRCKTHVAVRLVLVEQSEKAHGETHHDRPENQGELEHLPKQDGHHLRSGGRGAWRKQSVPIAPEDKRSAAATGSKGRLAASDAIPCARSHRRCRLRDQAGSYPCVVSNTKPSHGGAQSAVEANKGCPPPLPRARSMKEARGSLNILPVVSRQYK